MTGPGADVHEFNPHLVAPIPQRVAGWNSWWLGLVGPVSLIVVLAASWVEGTSGGWADAQCGRDMRRILSGRVDGNSAASFPAIRDLASVILLATLTLTCVITHRQWQLMRACIPVLVRSGVLIPAEAPADVPRAQRVLGLERLIGPEVTPAERLAALVGRLNGILQQVGRGGSLVVGAVSVVLMLLLAAGEYRNGLFAVLVPSSLDDEEKRRWLSIAYHSWWASFDHPFGAVCYIVIGTFGVFVILLQNIVGMASAYIVATMPALAKLDVDWLNYDGSNGWMPIARVFRTVRWSLALHGVALSLSVVLLGVKNFPWMAVLIIIWVCVVPIYTVLPSMTFRRVGMAARERRKDAIRASYEAAGVAPDDFERVQTFRTEIAHANAEVIRPLRTRRAEFPALVVLILLPIVLTAAQIVIPLRFGSQ